jgi:para-nitrobenzyl esterase
MRASRTGGVIVAIVALMSTAAIAASADRGATLIASSNVAVVETASGQVQGFVHRGVSTWRGIPYARADRFMPPHAPDRWPGVRPALSYGNICPQPVSPDLREPQTFISDTHYWPASEACQNLNVWSPAADGKKRPVMVWLHGGGFFSGSSNELGVYDGTNLAAKGDVVVVSLNHRLNALGFMDLSAYGPQYAGSANVGMLDIVAGLQWVRDNIARFGGDPANVTIFGQSGGGAKVTALLASPLAKGLFGKAVIQSGAPGGFGPAALDQATARRVAALTLANAGLSAGDVGKLAALPYDALVVASDKALRQVSAERNSGGAPLGFPTVNWSPVVDGRFLTEVPFAGGAPVVSKGVPLMVGSTLSEFGNFPNPMIAGHEHWSEADALAWLRRTRGPQADAVAAAYKKAYPALAPGVWPTIDTGLRGASLRVAAAKAAQGDPVYNYLFAWRSPVLDYTWAAGHSSEIGLVFDNPDAEEQALGGGPVVDRLAAEMSSAWIAFARTGDPNAHGVPRWPRFTAQQPATLVFDARSESRVGHDADLVRLSAPPQ